MPGRVITYTTKSATLSAVSPVLYSAQNTEVNQIYQDLNDLDAGMALKAGESIQNFATNNLAISGTVTKSGQPLVIAGYLQGTVDYQNATTLPKISAGVREFKGTYFPLAADYQLLSSDAALACNQSLDTYHWYNFVMDSTGALKWLPAFDITSPLVSGRSIGAGGVVVTGTTFVINMASTAGMAAGNDIVLKDTDGGLFTCDGPFKIVSVSAGVSVTVQGRAVGNGAYNGGTCDSYYRINTLHGAIGGVTTDTDIKKFTPSQQWCPSLQCYGLNRYGIPDSNPANIVYRVLGVGYNDNTTTSLLYTISYKSGKIKNDNLLKLEDASAFGIVRTKIAVFNTIKLAWGSNYIYTTSANNGASIGFLKSMGCSVEFSGSFGTAQYFGITKNTTQYTTSIAGVTDDNELLTTYALASIPSSITTPFRVQNGDTLYPHTEGLGAFFSNVTRVKMVGIE